MICVRHGLMIVGLPFGGKTTTYRILAEALEGIEKRVSIAQLWSITLTLFTFIGRQRESCHLFSYEPQSNYNGPALWTIRCRITRVE